MMEGVGDHSDDTTHADLPGTGDEGCHDNGQEEIVEMAKVALALLKQGDKEMLQQVTHLVRTNTHLAQQVFTTEIEGWTPVHACALRGKKKVLKVMLHAGIDVNLRMGQPEGLPAQCTLLHMAANRQDKKMADYLLHHGADVNAKDSLGRSPLFYAARAGNKDVTKLLTEHGALLTPDQDVTSASTGHVLDVEEELTTPEPKLTRFCFLPLPHLHHHHHQHHHHQRLQEQQQQQQQQRDSSKRCSSESLECDDKKS